MLRGRSGSTSTLVSPTGLAGSAPAGALGLAEIGRRDQRPLALPVAETLLDQRSQLRRLDIADRRRPRCSRAGTSDRGTRAPSLGRACSVSLRADRRAGWRAAGRRRSSCALPRPRAARRRRARAFRRARSAGLPTNPLVAQRRLADHARKQLEALLELGRRRRWAGRACRPSGSAWSRHWCRCRTSRRAAGRSGSPRRRRGTCSRGTVRCSIRWAKPCSLSLLVERTGVDADADRDLVGRHAVVAHGIAQAVGQLAEHPFAYRAGHRCRGRATGSVLPRVQVSRCRLRALVLRRQRRTEKEEREERRESRAARRTIVMPRAIGAARVKG